METDRTPAASDLLGKLDGALLHLGDAVMNFEGLGFRKLQPVGQVFAKEGPGAGRAQLDLAQPGVLLPAENRQSGPWFITHFRRRQVTCRFGQRTGCSTRTSALA
jgi:hypothetical protein